MGNSGIRGLGNSAFEKFGVRELINSGIREGGNWVIQIISSGCSSALFMGGASMAV